MRKQKWEDFFYQILFPVLLACYPLRHINQGVDLMDTGYSLGNYLFFEQAQGTWWALATYLANATGSFLMRLPFGNTMMGMNFYTSLLVSVLAVSVYFFLSKKLPKVFVFIGEILAISLCWCPTVILYNYMTYFFFTMGILLLYVGLIRQKKGYLFFAGITLGINVMVRFPNVVEAALILCVWYYAFLKKKKWKEIWQETGLCLLGYIMGIYLVLLPIVARFGIDAYLGMLNSIANMGESATDYSVLTMVWIAIKVYGQNIKWLFFMLAGILAGTVWFSVFRERFLWLKRISYVLGVCVLFRWFYGQGMFNVRYDTYDSIFKIGIVFLWISLFLYVWILISKRTEEWEKLLSSMLLILIFVTPLGSNNHLYPNLNNLFLVAPVTLCFLWKYLFQAKQWQVKRTTIAAFPMQYMIWGLLIGFFVQSLLFGWVFVFRGSREEFPRDTKIEGVPVLEGMYTDSQRAEDFMELSDFVLENNLQNRELLTFGNLPALPYYLHMSPALSTTWCDLPSFTDSMFQEDMEKLYQKGQEKKPLVIFHITVDAYQKQDEYMLQYYNVPKNYYDGNTRLAAIQQLLEEYSYQEVLRNGSFVVYWE